MSSTYATHRNLGNHTHALHYYVGNWLHAKSSENQQDIILLEKNKGDETETLPIAQLA